MSAPLGYYDESYPPSVWESAPLVAATARRSASEGAGTAETVGPVLTVSAGTPGSYEPEVAAVDRPRNLDELREQTRLDDTAPWPAGSFLPIGTKGKRAHWTGAAWAGGTSPGYPDAELAIVVTSDGAEHVGVLPASAAVELEVDE